MLVEEFALSEIDTHPECESERRAIIERLGLAGQADATGIRWPAMDRETSNVYRAICPESTTLEAYAIDPIPLRVLEIAEKAKPHFARLLVWHPRSGASTDPVLVGERTVSGTTTLYALARWGEVLDEWPALVKKAAAIIRGDIIAHAESSRASADASIRTAQSLGDAELIARYRGFTFSPF